MNLRVAVSGKAEGLQPLRRSESEPEEGVCPVWDKAHTVRF